MKVCVVNDRFSSSAPGGFYRIQGIARALHELGHDVIQVSRFFAVRGIEPYPDVTSKKARSAPLVRTPIDLVRRLRHIDSDVVLIELPFPWTKAFVGIVEAARGSRVFFDFGEYWIEAANRLHQRIATRFLRSALRSAKGASVTTAALKQVLVDLGLVGPEHVLYVPSGVDSMFFLPEPPSAVIAAGGPVVGFAGTVSVEQGCASIFDLAVRVHGARPDVRFLIVGDGPFLPTLRDRTRHAGLMSNFTFTGRVPRSELPGLVRAMDIGLSLKPNRGPAAIGTFPQKVPEYMAVGSVPLSTPLPEARNIITHGVDGLITEVEDMPDAIVSLIEDVPRRKRMSAAAASTARARFDWRHLVGRLLDFWARSPP